MPPEWMKPTGVPWKRLQARPVYDNPWISITEFDAEAPTGARTIYGLVGYKNHAIGILPLHEDGTVTLVGQHRFPLRNYSWEIPEGGVPVGTDVLEGAQRELLEETGLVASDWRQVLTYELSNSVSDETGVGFIAMGFRQSEAQPEATESLALARAPFMEVLEQALQGGILDVISLAMLLRAYHMAMQGELPPALAEAMLRKVG